MFPAEKSIPHFPASTQSRCRIPSGAGRRVETALIPPAARILAWRLALAQLHPPRTGRRGLIPINTGIGEGALFRGRAISAPRRPPQFAMSDKDGGRRPGRPDRRGVGSGDGFARHPAPRPVRAIYQQRAIDAAGSKSRSPGPMHGDEIHRAPGFVPWCSRLEHRVLRHAVPNPAPCHRPQSGPSDRLTINPSQLFLRWTPFSGAAGGRTGTAANRSSIRQTLARVWQPFNPV